MAFSDHRSPELYTFIKNLPHILPCKYCRESLKKFYKESPLRESYKNSEPDRLAKWMYEIHNDVNNKLRKQGLLKTPNPTFAEVKEMYEPWLTNPPEHILGFDFFKSVAYAKSKSSKEPELKEWWNSVGEALPFSSWREQWKEAEKREGKAPVEKGKQAMIAWLYKIQGKQNYNDFTKEARVFSSSCKKGITCRAIKTKQRETIKVKRRKTLKQVGGFL
jgi:hypothetical protein